MNSSYRTRDLPLAVHLILAGHSVRQIIQSPDHSNRVLFVFEPSEQLKADVQSYLQGSVKVVPCSYELVRAELLAKARQVLQKETH